MASPPPVGNTTFYFLFLLFSSLSVSTIFNYSVVLDGNLPAPQFWPGIWRWCINVLLSSTLIFLLLLSFMFSCFPWISTYNKTGSPSDVLGASLAICGTTISSLNCFTRIPLIKALLLVMIEALIVCRNGHENMVLHATPYPRARETVYGFPFITKRFL